MKKNFFHTIALPIIIVIIGGFICVGLSWVIYLCVYLGIETIFYPNNPLGVPADAIRGFSTITLCIISSFILFTKWHNRLKAAIFIAPLTVMFITIILSFYEKPLIGAMIVFLLASTFVFLIHKVKKPWLYYVSIVFSVILAFLYAWPHV